MIKSFKINYFLKHINKVAPGVTRIKESRNMKDIEQIGIVLDGTDKASVSFAADYIARIKAQGKAVEVLAYVPKTEKNAPFPLRYFTKQHINWYYKPEAGHVRDFINRSFDVLINLSPDKILPLEYICALSTSKFIIGNGTHHLNGYYDCLIKVNDSHSPERFMENAQHYLNLQA